MFFKYAGPQGNTAGSNVASASEEACLSLQSYLDAFTASESSSLQWKLFPVYVARASYFHCELCACKTLPLKHFRNKAPAKKYWRFQFSD